MMRGRTGSIARRASRHCRSMPSRSTRANANRVWVAMDRGVSQSFDAGAHWADFSNSLPNCYVGDLCFHPHAWVLRAGTRNRGAWEIPVDGWMTARVRRAVPGQPDGQPDPAMVHLQLAGDVACALDRDADDVR